MIIYKKKRIRGCVMKKFIVLFVMIGVICYSSTIAENVSETSSHSDEKASIRWQQSYRSYGRTIDVDVDIYIPNEETIPVIKVHKAFPIPEPQNSDLKKEYDRANHEDQVNSYDFDSTDYWTYVENAFPPRWGKTKNDEDFQPDKMASHDFDLYEYTYDQAYADNNSLTVQDAIKIAQGLVQRFYPNVEIKVDTIWIAGQSYWKENNQPIQELGAYVLNMSQCFHGVPIMAEICQTYNNSISREPNWNSYRRGTVFAQIVNDTSWLITCRFYQEANIVCDNTTLLSFDSVKDKIEKLILEGYIRRVFSVGLGYVQFETENPEEQILLPCWVAWCEYHQDGPQSEVYYGTNNSKLMFDGNNIYYRPIIINAQTGELFNPESNTKDCCMCPYLDE